MRCKNLQVKPMANAMRTSRPLPPANCVDTAAGDPSENVASFCVVLPPATFRLVRTPAAEKALPELCTVPVADTGHAEPVEKFVPRFSLGRSDSVTPEAWSSRPVREL